METHRRLQSRGRLSLVMLPVSLLHSRSKSLSNSLPPSRWAWRGAANGGVTVADQSPADRRPSLSSLFGVVSGLGSENPPPVVPLFLLGM